MGPTSPPASLYLCIPPDANPLHSNKCKKFTHAAYLSTIGRCFFTKHTLLLFCRAML